MAAGELRGDQPSGGARRDRTDDLMLAKHALSQLSYGPILFVGLRRRRLRPQPWLTRHQARRPFGLAALRAVGLNHCGQRLNKNGGPGRTRTSDLTLIKRAL